MFLSIRSPLIPSIKRLSRPCLSSGHIRNYQSSAIPKGERPSPKDHAKDARTIAKRETKIKAKNKQEPKLHPLYMEVPTALRYLRAAEVGQPSKKTTISLMVNVLPEKGSVPLQGKIFYPKPVKHSNVLVFTDDAQQEQELIAMNENMTVGGADLIQKIANDDKSIDLDSFTQCLASASIMKDLKAIARKLGPRGLMPTPKRNTVSDNLIQLLKENFGALTFKQKGDHLAMPVARCDFSDEEVLTNLKAAATAIYNSQPAGTKKPNLIGTAYLSTTLGPSVVVDIRQ